MISAAIATLTGWGLSSKAAKRVLLGGGILLALGAAVLAWNVWLHFHDQGVRDDHDQAVNLERETQARQADANQADQARQDDARNTDETTELEGVLNNDPESNRPLTDSERAYLRCVRLQQRARETGQPAPACQ